MKPKTNAFKVTIIQTATPVKEKVALCYYQLTKGSPGILSYVKKESSSGLGQNVLHIVNSVLN